MEKMALTVIKQYMEGWKQNELAKIIDSLAPDCLIIESHGPSYYGIDEVTDWFHFWLRANSTVQQWDIHTFYYLTKERIAFLQWDFACQSNNQYYAFPGMSIIKFVEQKISFIQEYRMTHTAYSWNGIELKSS
ncbi:MAG: putative cytosolic protein [Gammaproteobacteria bacterium]|jgi:hypothetical protein|nr:putative cytosolic protein [Gammaproteobacteria bacterium]